MQRMAGRDACPRLPPESCAGAAAAAAVQDTSATPPLPSSTLPIPHFFFFCLYSPNGTRERGRYREGTSSCSVLRQMCSVLFTHKHKYTHSLSSIVIQCRAPSLLRCTRDSNSQIGQTVIDTYCTPPKKSFCFPTDTSLCAPTHTALL